MGRFRFIVQMRNSRIPTPNKRVTRRQAAKQEAILAEKLAKSLTEVEETETPKIDAQGDAPTELINTKIDETENQLEPVIEENAEMVDTELPVTEAVINEPSNCEANEENQQQNNQTVGKTIGKWIYNFMRGVFRLCLGTLIFVYILSVSRQHLTPILRRDLPGWMFDFENPEMLSTPDPVEIINALTASLVTVVIM